MAFEADDVNFGQFTANGKYILWSRLQFTYFYDQQLKFVNILRITAFFLAVIQLTFNPIETLQNVTIVEMLVDFNLRRPIINDMVINGKRLANEIPPIY